MLLEELRKQVIEHSQKMLHDGLTMGTGGNISARDPKSGLVAITPSSMEYDTLVPSDVPILDVNGKVIEGEHRPSTETPMHTLIYRERSDVMAIVHNHAAFATGFASANMPIPCVLNDIAEIAGALIRVAPFARPGSVELGQSVLSVLRTADVALLQNHGCIVVGPTLPWTYGMALCLERGARSYYYALSVGHVSTIPDADALAIRDHMKEVGARIAGKQRPSG